MQKMQAQHSDKSSPRYQRFDWLLDIAIIESGPG